MHGVTLQKPVAIGLRIKLHRKKYSQRFSNVEYRNPNLDPYGKLPLEFELKCVKTDGVMAQRFLYMRTKA